MDDPRPNFWYYGATRIPEDAQCIPTASGGGISDVISTYGAEQPRALPQLNDQKALAALRLLPGTFRVASPPAGSSLVHLPPTRKVTAADEIVLLPTQPGLNSSGTGHPKRILLNKVQSAWEKKRSDF